VPSPAKATALGTEPLTSPLCACTLSLVAVEGRPLVSGSVLTVSSLALVTTSVAPSGLSASPVGWSQTATATGVPAVTAPVTALVSSGTVASSPSPCSMT